MSASNETLLKILGAVILRFSGKYSSGEVIETCQVVYATDSTDRIYISCKGCVALGFISKDFPTVDKVPHLMSVIVNAKDSKCKTDT